MLVEFSAFAALITAAWLTNDGLRAAAAYDARSVANPPVIPRKLFGAALSGLTITALGLLSFDQSVFGAMGAGAVAGIAQLAAFGLDPMRKKGTGPDAQASVRAARAIDEAEKVVDEIAAASRRIGDRRLEARVARLCDQAREVFRAIEIDPRDLARARRFLSVYLLGLRDATLKFADVFAYTRDPVASEMYQTLLGDLETSFAMHRADLLNDNRGALDIEIEVLRERLQRDGLLARLS